MTADSVSVIVVSRNRPDALTLCLKGIAQLFHLNFEVVVVADPAGLSALRTAGFDTSIKSVSFDQANISQARNLGVMAAAGEIVAFIDDDAVPEPTWLGFLTDPMRAPDVAAAGGYVRGRNGISFQYTARAVDAVGQHTPLSLSGDAPVVFDAPPGLAIKTEGTNCAFRRDVLMEMGGFDPAFPFYMDETDLNLRLAQDGRRTAIVPLAQVHHGFAASDRRHASRMPRSLFDVGASQVVLLRKHAPDADLEPVLQLVRTEQRARLLRHMVAGTCEPRDVGAIMATLQAGIVAGQTRDIVPLQPLRSKAQKFLQFVSSTPPKPSIHLAGRRFKRQALRAQAANHLSQGNRVSLFLFSASMLFHRVKFTGNGIWEQTGGLWGKSDRSDRLVTPWRMSTRIRRELDRVGVLRKFTK